MFFWRKKGKVSSVKNKTIIMLSDGDVYSVRINRFFQFFIILSAIVLSSFITYHVTIYIKTQSSMQEKDHKIFLGETINKNLSSHLYFIIEEINAISENIAGGRKSDSKSISQNKVKEASKSNNKVLTDSDLNEVKGKIKKTVINLDSTIDSKTNALLSAIVRTGISDLLKSQKILNYKTYKIHIPNVLNINYSAKDIASDVLSEIKYKAQYYKLLQNLVKSLPTAYPMKGVRLTSHYGVRRHPILNLKMIHHGVDFKGTHRSPIHVTADGIVKFSGYSPSFGNVIMVSHGNEIMTIYAHLDITKVKTGQIVRRNDIIGLQGSTGRSSGEHLHYEVRFKGKSLNPVNFLKLNDALKDNS